MKYIKKFEIDNGSSVEEYIPIPPIATSEVTGGIKASLRTEENVEAAIDENDSLFVPEYPSLDNKVNKNGYGEEDCGKVLGTDSDGNVVLKEVKSASDNNPIGVVEKTLNPSVSDCFNSSIKNLKLYGQSTQGADPSPTNPQEITAISEFSGQVNNGSEQSQPFTYTPTQLMYSTQDGSISDYVDVENGVEVYQLKKVIFDGNENWSMSGVNYGDYVGFYLNEYIARSLVMCNKLPYYNFENNEAIKEAIYIFGDGSLRILILKSRLTETSANGFKTWLSQNPITVVYPLVFPTETPIPQEQLAILRALYTYNSVTNFLCNAPVSFTYEQSLQIIIDNILKSINNINANKLLL